LSVDGSHDIVIVVRVAPDSTWPSGTDGGVVSTADAHVAVEAVIVACAERLPAASYASTEMSYPCPQTSPDTAAVVVVAVATMGPLLRAPA
jgi:hypothetical protein